MPVFRLFFAVRPPRLFASILKVFEKIWTIGIAYHFLKRPPIRVPVIEICATFHKDPNHARMLQSTHEWCSSIRETALAGVHVSASIE